MNKSDSPIESALKPYLQELILEILAEMKQGEKKAVENKLFTLEEAATYLHLSKACLYSKTSTNQIPFMKTGKNLIFSKEELDSWLFKKKKPTTAELDFKAEEILHRNRTKTKQKLFVKKRSQL